MGDTLARSFDLVMFDLDGTLIATSAELCDAVNDTLARFGLPAVHPSSVEGWIGHGTRELMVQALAHSGRTASEAVRTSSVLALASAEFDLHYRKRCGTRSYLYPRVREVLEELREQGVKMAVVTNKDGQYTSLLLKAHQLTGFFGRVISGDTLPTKKPSPEGILDCLWYFQVGANRALFVGDSSVDVATARKAGVTVWALSHGYNMGLPIAASQPDRVMDAFGAITDDGNSSTG